MTDHLIVRVVVKLLIPFVLIFALYVQFHGDYGPGGGFQAGVIFATGFIVYSLVFGVRRAMRVMPPLLITGLVSAGVLIYAGVGFAALAVGGGFLDYSAFSPEHPAHGQHYGILAIELGVGITVAAVMIAVFFTFAERYRR